MNIRGVIWLEKIAGKIRSKHQVSPEEVEQVLLDQPKFYFVQKGHRKEENVYLALGRTNAGRYLVVIFVYKKSKDALILSGRRMTTGEKNRYHEK